MTDPGYAVLRKLYLNKALGHVHGVKTFPVENRINLKKLITFISGCSAALHVIINTFLFENRVGKCLKTQNGPVL